MAFFVRVGFDPQARVYYVIETNISGLHVEAATFEQFAEVVEDALPDLVAGRRGGARIEYKVERELASA